MQTRYSHHGVTMTYRGHIKNGVAVLDTPIKLPDGTPVQVQVEPLAAEFWQSKSLEQLAIEQRVKPAAHLADLTGDWPPEDAMDDFLAFVREARR
jgi:hypothetical protein